MSAAAGPAWAAWLRVALPFSLRTYFAGLLALFTAYVLQLDAPYSAMTTVWIVAHPSPGQVLSKSYYRVIGTLVGSVVSVAVIAFFAQTPELYVLALAVWAGLCTVGSNLLTNFRSYGTLLAGYTVGLVTSAAISNPDQVFFAAVARCSDIVLGIGCSVLVTSLFAPHHARDQVLAGLRRALEHAARRVTFPWRGDSVFRFHQGRDFLGEMIALNPQIEYAAAESSHFRVRAPLARSLLAHLFGALSSQRALEAHLRREGGVDAAVEERHDEMVRLVEQLPDRLAEGREGELSVELAAWRGSWLDPEPPERMTESAISNRVVLDRMDDVLGHVTGALRDWKAIHGRRVDRADLWLNFHRDHRQAWINGARAFLTILAVGAFWILTAWPDGPSALVLAMVICSLFSTAPFPELISLRFLKGATVALVVSFLFKFFLLNHLSSFETLGAALALVLIPAGCLLTIPAVAVETMGFLIVSLTLLTLNNPVDFNVATFLNSGLAYYLGVLAGALAFRLILPPDPAAARRYVVHRVRYGLQIIARRRSVAARADWSTRMYDRIYRLYDPRNPSGTSTDEWLESGLSALNLGNELIRLRVWLAEDRLIPELAAPARRVVAAFAQLLRHPGGAEQAVRAALEEVRALPPFEAPEARLWQARLLGALEDMRGFWREHPQFLHGGMLSTAAGPAPVPQPA